MRKQYLATSPPIARWTDEDRIDASLMVAVRDRDNHAAYSALLPRIDRAIDAPLFRYLPASEIDDGRAEVHLRIWSRRTLYREDCGTVRAWVGGGISLHYAWDWLRKHAKAPRLIADMDELPFAVRDPTPAVAAENSDWMAHIGRLCSRVLADFPPHVQASFTLRLQGVEYAEIAGIVGRPVGTIASSVHRVRTKLLALLNCNDHHRILTKENPMTNNSPHGVETIELKAILARFDELKQDLATTKDRLADLEARVNAEGGGIGQGACFVPDTLPGLVGVLRDRLRLLLEDPAQYQSDTAWAEVEDLADELRPVMKQLPKGLFVKVWTRLRESRELLKQVRRHRAALAQIRGVLTLLESVADEDPEAGGVLCG